MRRFFALAAALVLSIAAYAYTPGIRDIDITVRLGKTGTASILEKWNVCVGDGTEWYLVRDNLGDIEIENLAVSDENGAFRNIGEWDVDRSREQKKGLCGIVHKSNGGDELCWGVGTYGDHKYTVSYDMTNAVKSLSDYDILHLQLVSPGLTANPQHVKVTIEADGVQIDTTNTRIWGFGFEGTASMEDGKVVFESSEPFSYYSSVITLLRFKKGIFSPTSVRDTDFQTVLDAAMEGADFGYEQDDSGSSLSADFGEFLYLIMMLIFFIFPIASSSRKTRITKKQKKQIMGGIKPEDAEWCREIPFEGDLDAADCTLKKLGEDKQTNALASALILRMVYKGAISVNKDSNGNVELSFNGDESCGSDDSARRLYSMMKQASGSDEILQHKEFSKWSSSHKADVKTWVNHISVNGKSSLVEKKWTEVNGSYTSSGQAEARKLMGLKKFLQDFTLMKEKETIEAVLWQEYLVYGALFGIADLVAKQLKDIDPQIFEQTMVYDYSTLYDVIRSTQRLGSNITNATVPTRSYTVSRPSGGWGGFGGGTSFGGGGGFSGGGFGGGSR